MNNIALLIDADNVPSSNLSQLMEKLEEIGQIKLKRVYGDFSSSNINGWKERAIRCKLVPIQQFSKNGGNSTDMRLLIDAMDMIYTHPEIDIFCIASSDADYSSLVLRLQEAGKYVIIAGREPISMDMKLSANEFFSLESNKNKNESSSQKRSNSIKNFFSMKKQTKNNK